MSATNPIYPIFKTLERENYVVALLQEVGHEVKLRLNGHFMLGKSTTLKYVDVMHDTVNGFHLYKKVKDTSDLTPEELMLLEKETSLTEKIVTKLNAAMKDEVPDSIQ